MTDEELEGRLTGHLRRALESATGRYPEWRGSPAHRAVSGGSSRWSSALQVPAALLAVAAVVVAVVLAIPAQVPAPTAPASPAAAASVAAPSKALPTGSESPSPGPSPTGGSEPPTTPMASATAPVSVPTASSEAFIVTAPEAAAISTVTRFVSAINDRDADAAIALLGPDAGGSDCDFEHRSAFLFDGSDQTAAWVRGRVADHERLTVERLESGTPTFTGALAVTFARRQNDTLRRLGAADGKTPSIAASVVLTDGLTRIAQFGMGPYGADAGIVVAECSATGSASPFPLPVDASIEPVSLSKPSAEAAEALRICQVLDLYGADLVGGMGRIGRARDVVHYAPFTGREPEIQSDAPAWVVTFRGELPMPMSPEVWIDPTCVVVGHDGGVYATGPVRSVVTGRITDPQPAVLQPDRALPPLAP